MFIVTKEIDSENISKLCRTCLREDGEKMICLFVGPAGSSLAAKLRSLSCLEVWQGDGLPEKLCDRCVTRAESALLFREQCRAADRALRQAAAKVAGHSSCSTISGCKLYQQNQGFTPTQSTQRNIKCLECGAIFMNYQDLCFHKRSHSSLIQYNTPLSNTLHITEGQNSYANLPSSLNHHQMMDNINDDILLHQKKFNLSNDLSQKNEATTCALHCSFYNYPFPNQSQAVRSNFLTCSGNGNADLSCNGIEIGANSSDSTQNFIYPKSDLQCFRDVNNSVQISNINFSGKSVLNSQEEDEEQDDDDDDEEQEEVYEINRNDSIDLVNLQSFRYNSKFSQNGHANNPENLQNIDANEDNKLLNNKSLDLIEKKHVCKLCGKSFAQKSKLMTHELSHTGERPFKCSKCDKSYTSKSKLNAHIRLHNQVNIHQCNICKKIFSYPSYLIEHLKTHCQNNETKNMKVQKFECSTCSKTFSLKKNLRAHMKFHSGKNLFYCEICHKPFTQKFNLKVHLKIHKNTRLYECEYCDKTFNGKGNYTEHLRIHTKIKPFVCQLCDKAFSQSSHLKAHEATHTTNRPHQCRLCGKKFKLLSHLQRHTNAHTASKSYKCVQCNQMFSQAFSLKRHMKRHNEAN